MKILRNRFNQLFNAKMRNPSVTTESQAVWFELIKEALVSKKEDVAGNLKKEKVEGPKVQITLKRMAD